MAYFKHNREAYFCFTKQPFNLALYKDIPLEKVFCKQKKMVNFDLHYSRTLLNPYFLYNKKPANDQDATNAFKRVLMKIY